MKYCVGVKRQKNCLFEVYYIYLQGYSDVMSSGSKIRGFDLGLRQVDV